jgi:hypothetical protein
MKTFKEFYGGINVQADLPWKEIVEYFDDIDSSIVQQNGTQVRVIGKKDGRYADMYIDYKNKETAKEVQKKVASFIGVKGKMNNFNKAMGN